MEEKLINIGGRLHDTSKDHTVSGANEIRDDDLQKKQSVINAEQQEFNQEQEGINADTYRKNEVYNKEETNNIVSRTPETDVIVINVPAASQSDIAGWLDANTPSGIDPETGRSVRANKLYRVPGPTNETYSEWAWDGTEFIMLANKDYGIDDFAKARSTNTIKGSGVFNVVNDISEWGVVDHQTVDDYFMYDDGPHSNENMQYWKIPIVSGKNYAFSGYLPSATTVPYVYYLDSNGDPISHDIFVGDSVIHTDELLKIPDGAAYICLNIQTQYVSSSKIKANTVIKSKDLKNNLEEVTGVLSEFVLLGEDDTINGHFMTVNGEEDSQYFSYKKYEIDSSKLYQFTSSFNGRTNIPFVVWLANDESVLGAAPYEGSEEDIPVSYTDQLVIPPDDARYLCLNMLTSRSSVCVVKESSGGIIEVNKEIANINSDIDELHTESNGYKSNYFTFDRCAIKPDGSLWENVDGVKATDFLPITGLDDIVAVNLWSSATISALVFYDIDKTFISFVTGTENPSGQNDVNVEVSDIPEGAKYIRCSANYLREGPHQIVNGVNTGSVIELANTINENVSEIKESLTAYNYTEMDDYTLKTGGFYDNRGRWSEFGAYQVWKFAIDGGQLYAFTGNTVAGADLPYVVWFDGDPEDGGQFLEYSYTGSATEPTNYVKQVVKAPQSAAYLCLNMLSSQSGNFAAYVAEGEMIDVSGLKDEVDSITGGVKKMKVTINGNNIYVRTALDDTNDIIINFSQFENGNMRPVATFMGLHTASDSTILANRIHLWDDSTAPLRAVPQYWHLYAQHGIPLPLATITNNPLTSDDLGSWWKDQSNRQYQIGKIIGNQVYLVPKVTQSGTPGIVTRDWRDSSHDSYPTSLTHMSGAAHTDSLTIASCSQIQLRPIQTSSDRKFVCDGIEVGDGVYQCDKFVISETLACIDVTHVTQYFPNVVSDQIAAYVTNSFIFKGTSIGFNQIFDCQNPVQFSYYGANQAQHLQDINGFECYAMVPKVKKNNFGGSVMSKMFRSRITDGDVTVYRTSTDLYNVNKAPDRQITVLKTNGDVPVIGFASGISLIRGVTRDEVRNTYIAEYDGSKGNALLFSPANGNKFYVGVITGANTEHFTNYLMQPDFCKEFSTYFTYFKPTNTIQSYWYNDGDTTVIYAHAESNTGRTYINVSDLSCEGKALEIVEKTNGAALITDSVVNGKICVSFTSSDANYIVLKTK